MNDKQLRQLVVDELEYEPSIDAADIGVAVIPASLQNLGRTGVNYRVIREATPKAELAVAWRPERSSPRRREAVAVRTDGAWLFPSAGDRIAARRQVGE